MSEPGAWPAWPFWLLLAAVAALAAGLLAWRAAMRVRRADADAREGAEREALLGKAAESEARLRALIELSSDWYWEMDESLRFTALRLGRNGRLMVPVADVLGKHRWELPGELVQPPSWDEHKAALEARQPFQNLIMRRWTPDGSVVYHLSSGEPIFDATGAFRGYRGLGKDITEQIRAQESIERLASFDSLTQLPNRQAFDDRAQQLLSSAFIEGRVCALLYIDLDDFRLLNNSYGHQVGDQMLAIVAQRLRERVREPNLLGRRGGDELVALLVDVPRPESAAEIARELIDSIQQPVRMQGMEVSVTPSVGIALFTQDGKGLDELLSAADAAMREAKEHGKRSHAFCTDSVKRKVELRTKLEQRLRSFDMRDFRLF
ncbi:MAG TPA: sensor domain-containing diguanylate cyclase [Burkholderiaceae bacterium]